MLIEAVVHQYNSWLPTTFSGVAISVPTLGAAVAMEWGVRPIRLNTMFDLSGECSDYIANSGCYKSPTSPRSLTHEEQWQTAQFVFGVVVGIVAVAAGVALCGATAGVGCVVIAAVAVAIPLSSGAYAVDKAFGHKTTSSEAISYTVTPWIKTPVSAAISVGITRPVVAAGSSRVFGVGGIAGQISKNTFRYFNYSRNSLGTTIYHGAGRYSMRAF